MVETGAPGAASPRIVVISASVGAGHDGAADELIRRLDGLGFAVDRHDFLDLMPRRSGQWLRGFYKRQLSVAPRSWGWLLSVEGQPWFNRRSVAATAIADKLTLSAVGSDAAAIVSTYPLASQVLGRLRRKGALRSPVITYLTDMSVHPLWVAEGVDTHLAIHDVAAEEAKELAAADVRVIAPAVAPRFRAPCDPEEARRRFGLPLDRPLALIVAGAWGVGSVEDTSYDIAATGAAVPVVACGRNDNLFRRISRSGHAVALGWVDDMPSLMRACSVVVQNAGGLSSLEGLASGVPVVTYRCLPGHGQTNAVGLEKAGWVPWFRSFDELGVGLRRLFVEPRPASINAAEDPESVIATIAALHSRNVAA
jgi:UDP-N-acetylglucosamine:LPS N-acetylglucosamine transferase